MTRLLTVSLIASFSICPALRAKAQKAPGFLPRNGVVLFQGDSITDGGRQRTGSDYNHIMGQDYAYILAAELGAKYPEANVTFVNRGISGNTVLQLGARWQADTLAVKPDVLSILVGVNDTLFPAAGGESVEEYEAGYDKLLSETVAALPATKIVLGAPFLLPVGGRKGAYATQMAAVAERAAVVAKLGAKYHLPVIDYQKAFDDASKRAPAEHWSWDGVHPTYAGHALMAQAWLAVVEKAWGK